MKLKSELKGQWKPEAKRSDGSGEQRNTSVGSGSECRGIRLRW